MQKTSIIFLLAIISLAASCDNNKDENTNVALNFKAKFGNEPLVMYQDYAAPNGHNFQLRVFNFFISEVVLVNENDEEVELTNHDYINFNSTVDQATAEAGATVNFTDIPVGNYKTIRLGIGLSPELNAMDPSDFPSSDAMGLTGNYWTAWDSYIFSRTEGQIDTLPNASGGEVQFLYHSGVDGMYQQISFDKSISLAAGEDNTITFNVNAQDIFYKAGAEIDIPALFVSHSGDPQTEDYAIVKKVIENIAAAVSIQ